MNFPLRKIIACSAGLGLIFLAGCMTSGEQLDRAAVAKLQKGHARAKVEALFGKPLQTELGIEGKQLEVYQVRFTRKLPAPQRAFIFRTLTLLYDSSGCVENFLYHVGELPIRRTRMGWEAGESLDAAVIAGIQKEIHSRNDVSYTFGPPTIEGLDRTGDSQAGWYFLQGTGVLFTKGQALLVAFDSRNRVKDYVLRELKP